MVGMAKKKENSVAVLRCKPANIPAIIVAPEREVPGIMAKHWAKPTIRACFQVISSKRTVLCSSSASFIAPCFAISGRRSTHSIISPPITSVKAYTINLPSSKLLIKLIRSKPIIAAGKNASKRLRTNSISVRSPVKKPLINWIKRSRKIHITAKIEPNWMTIS